MRIDANFELMRDIDSRYQSASGLTSRAHYSIFYGPLARSGILVMNANPGGTPDNYNIVRVMEGEHEYVEGRHSGPTTRNASELLLNIMDSNDPEDLRKTQVLNRFFRRSPQRPETSTEQAYMAEARPFVAELIEFIQPRALLFGGDAGVALFAQAHGGTFQIGNSIMGPNGRSEAVYFREYELKLPYYPAVPAYGIYHPSKMNRHFRENAFPLLRERLGPLLAAGSS